jgi:hypothetical protein
VPLRQCLLCPLPLGLVRDSSLVVGTWPLGIKGLRMDFSLDLGQWWGEGREVTLSRTAPLPDIPEASPSLCNTPPAQAPPSSRAVM